MAQRISIPSIYQPQGFVHLVAASLHDDGVERAGEVPTSCGTVWLAHVSKWRTQPDVLQRSQQEITTAHLQNLLHWRRALDFCL